MTREEYWRARLRGKRLLIFDFDGTVADTSPLHESAFMKVLEPFGIGVDYAAIAGLRTAEAMRACFIAAGQEVTTQELERLVQAKQVAVRGAISSGLKPLPGVDDFLRWAGGQFRLAMVTSGSRATVGLALAAIGYEGLFDPLIAAEDVSNSKPHPEGFLKALSVTDRSALESMVLEDSNAGIEGAIAAGIDYWDVRSEPLDLRHSEL